MSDVLGTRACIQHGRGRRGEGSQVSDLHRRPIALAQDHPDANLFRRLRWNELLHRIISLSELGSGRRGVGNPPPPDIINPLGDLLPIGTVGWMEEFAAANPDGNHIPAVSVLEAQASSELILLLLVKDYPAVRVGDDH
jgi:hypothetical protein